MNENSNDLLFQIGLPTDRLSNVVMNWSCYEPRQVMVVSPSRKQADCVVVETHHAELASAILRDVPEAMVKTRELTLKITRMP